MKKTIGKESILFALKKKCVVVAVFGRRLLIVLTIG
jgi:hypothetical protein